MLLSKRPLSILAALLATLAAQSARADGSQCGPYGDAPALMVENVVPGCPGGKRLGPWNDSDGTPRYACLYEPAGATTATPLPLVVFLHGSLFPASTVYYVTNFLDYTSTADLTGDPLRPGFVLIAPEGRSTTHYYAFPDNRGKGWDNWYRNLSEPAGANAAGQAAKPNVDAATLDHFIAEEAATGKIDRDRVFISGWSNGAAMAILYALNRPQVAAAAVYSAPNPFDFFGDPCPQKPVSGTPASSAEIQVSNPGVAILHVHNACDIAGLCPNSEVMKTQLAALGGSFQDLILDSLGEEVQACDSLCGTNPKGGSLDWGSGLGFFNHLMWPRRWTSTMLQFMRQHPRRTTSAASASNH